MRALGFKKILAAIAMTALLGGCPDEEAEPDARIANVFDADLMLPDADTTDAEPPIDAAPMSTHSGTVSIHDTKVLNAPTLGHGLSIGIDFPELGRAPDYDEMPGSPLGCEATRYNLAGGDLPPVGGDEGTIEITGTAAPVPPCNFVAGKGYLCIAGGGADPAATVTDDSSLPMGTIPPGSALVTIPTATFGAVDVGRYISLAGATNAGNNGAFPILSPGAAAGQVIVGNPLAVTEAAFAATWTVLVGQGPNPALAAMGAPDPLTDADMVSVDLVPGGGMHFDFDSTAMGFPINAGDAFTLDDASAALITAQGAAATLDDGVAVTLDCAGAGGSCGTASGTIVTITTTDTAIPMGAPSYYFPGPTATVTVVRCARIGPGAIDIPAAAMEQIMMASPTRIRTTFLRVGFALSISSTPINPTTVVVGHSVNGFSTP